MGSLLACASFILASREATSAVALGGGFDRVKAATAAPGAHGGGFSESPVALRVFSMRAELRAAICSNDARRPAAIGFRAFEYRSRCPVKVPRPLPTAGQ